MLFVSTRNSGARDSVDSLDRYIELGGQSMKRAKLVRMIGDEEPLLAVLAAHGCR